jgi:hypothetical protein
MHKRVLATCMVGFFAVGPALAHPGGLNSEGCHNNRKTGDYHCHRAPSAVKPHSPPGQQSNSLVPAREAPAGQPSRSAAPGRAYANCAEARAAGAAPVRRGEPGYGPHLDRDNDGIGCEPYRGR